MYRRYGINVHVLLALLAHQRAMWWPGCLSFPTSRISWVPISAPGPTRAPLAGFEPPTVWEVSCTINFAIHVPTFLLTILLSLFHSLFSFRLSLLFFLQSFPRFVSFFFFSCQPNFFFYLDNQISAFQTHNKKSWKENISWFWSSPWRETWQICHDSSSQDTIKIRIKKCSDSSWTWHGTTTKI